MNPLPTFLREAFEADEPADGQPPASGSSIERSDAGPRSTSDSLSSRGATRAGEATEWTPSVRQAEEAVETLAAWSAFLGRAPGTEALWNRLAQDTAEGALRYGPFLDELQEMFDWDETQLRSQLNAALGSREKWSRTPFTGVRLLRLQGGPQLGKAEAYLAALDPGASVPLHRHPGEEVTFVLQGGYADDEGQEHHAGSLVRAPASDTFHSLRVIGSERCLIALRLEKRFVFASPLYRAFLRVFWK